MDMMMEKRYRVTVRFRTTGSEQQKSFDIDYADTIGEARRDVVGDLRQANPAIQIRKVTARRVH